MNSRSFHKTATIAVFLILPICQAFADYADSSDVTVDTRDITTGFQITMRRVTGSVIENAVSGATVDDPLQVKASDPTALAAQPVITCDQSSPTLTGPVATGGLVADGVTPLLFQVDATGTSLPDSGTQYEVMLEMIGMGKYNGSLTSKLQVLAANRCVAGTKFTLSPQSSRAFLVLSPINSEDITTITGFGSFRYYAPVIVNMKVRKVASARVFASYHFGIRKPPVVLVHGYNSDNTAWSHDFLSPIQIDRGNDFVIPQSYGTENQSFVNTFWDVKRLVGVLHGELANHIDGDPEMDWRKNWAFTRYDAIGHSQGGVLLRMLCSSETNNDGSNVTGMGFVPFRNQSNFFRGRFRRVITLGSPHVGSSMCEMALDLRNDSLPMWGSILANLGQTLGFLDPVKVFQEKFRIGDNTLLAQLNRNLACDPSARLHMVWTTVDGGQTPGHSGTNHVFYKALYLDQPTPTVSGLSPGMVVAPLGSDAVVSAESQGMGWPTPNQSSTVAGNYCHAAWGTTQTASTSVGQHALDLLNGAANQFGQVVIPRSVSDAMEIERGRIDTLASQVVSAVQARIKKYDEQIYESTPATLSMSRMTTPSVKAQDAGTYRVQDAGISHTVTRRNKNGENGT